MADTLSVVTAELAKLDNLRNELLERKLDAIDATAKIKLAIIEAQLLRRLTELDVMTTEKATDLAFLRFDRLEAELNQAINILQTFFTSKTGDTK